MDYKILLSFGAKCISLERLKEQDDTYIKDVFYRVWGNNSMGNHLLSKFMYECNKDAKSFIYDLDADNLEKFLLNF
ncbi:hypothetical protein [Empedobacter stercoris]|uniref:hypothetical protein n=1 Tax=Empedobacter stercoris TaxID=1628248 RepID=UPI0039EBCD69